MAKRSLSSLKRVRQNERRRLHNKARRSAVKSQVRSVLDAVAAGKPDTAAEFKKAVILLDRAAAHGLIHRNTAARKKSRLARRLAAPKALRP